MLSRSKHTSYFSVIILIAVNLIPLIGVVKFGADIGMLLFLYWLESLVIGALNIPKILSCRSLSAPHAMNEPPRRVAFKVGLPLCLFFTAHYGVFCFVHYHFLEAMFDDFPSLASLATNRGLDLAVLGLASSHLISMIINFYGRGEYLRQSAIGQIFAPYQRIFILQGVILASGLLAQASGGGVATLILLILVKTIVDLSAHFKEHRPINITQN